jgi:hypothetical protein
VQPLRSTARLPVNPDPAAVRQPPRSRPALPQAKLTSLQERQMLILRARILAPAPGRTANFAGTVAKDVDLVRGSNNLGVAARAKATGNTGTAMIEIAPLK